MVQRDLGLCQTHAPSVEVALTVPEAKGQQLLPSLHPHGTPACRNRELVPPSRGRETQLITRRSPPLDQVWFVLGERSLYYLKNLVKAGDCLSRKNGPCDYQLLQHPINSLRYVNNTLRNVIFAL